MGQIVVQIGQISPNGLIYAQIAQWSSKYLQIDPKSLQIAPNNSKYVQFIPNEYK